MLHFGYIDNHGTKHRLSVGDTIWYSRLKQRSRPVELKTDLTQLDDTFFHNDQNRDGLTSYA